MKNRKLWNRFLSWVLALVLSCLPGTALPVSAAEAVSYIEYSWDGSALSSQTKTVTDYTLYDGSNTSLDSGWYVVKDSVTVSRCLRATYNSTVNIILMDGATLTAADGIAVGSSRTLNIFAQSGGSNMGKIVVPSNSDGCSGIGAADSSDCGNINIHGGNLSLNGGGDHTPGLGADSNYASAAGYVINIYSGKLSSQPRAGGYEGNGINAYNGTLNIYGGDIAAYGVGYSAIRGSNVNIHGGNIKVSLLNSSGFLAGNFTIRGGNLNTSATATDGANAVSYREITLSGASAGEKILALYDANGDPIAYGTNDMTTMNTDKLYLHLPADSGLTYVETPKGLYKVSEDGFAALVHTHRYTGIPAYTQGEAQHTTVIPCVDCPVNAQQTKQEEHFGGVANCVSGAICKGCEVVYTAKNPSVHVHPDENGLCVCGLQMGAKVTRPDGSDKYYLTLPDALDAVADSTDSDTTVTVLVDTTVENYSVKGGIFTLDLNGKTVDGNGSPYILQLFGESVVTITGNGKMKNARFTLRATVGTFIVENGTFSGRTNGIFVTNGCSAYIYGGTFVAEEYGACFDVSSNEQGKEMVVEISGNAVFEGDQGDIRVINGTLTFTSPVVGGPYTVSCDKKGAVFAKSAEGVTMDPAWFVPAGEGIIIVHDTVSNTLTYEVCTHGHVEGVTCTICGKSFYVQIGDRYYSTRYEITIAANELVRLLRNWDHEYWENGGVDYTIDLNGFDLAIPTANLDMYVGNGGQTVTIINNGTDRSVLEYVYAYSNGKLVVMANVDVATVALNSITFTVDVSGADFTTASITVGSSGGNVSQFILGDYYVIIDADGNEVFGELMANATYTIEHVHGGGTATCIKPAVCGCCGAEYGYPDHYNHAGETDIEYRWDVYDSDCYVHAEMRCADCNSYIDSADDYAQLVGQTESKDCLHPGTRTWSFTCSLNDEEYTETYTHVILSDNHVGQFNDGFCTACGGYEAAKWNEEEYLYEISNAGQLYWYAQQLNEKNAEIYVKLMNDIVIPEDAPNWVPITASYAYFDGNFKTISGLKCVGGENDTYVGFFGNEVWWYEISNLHIADSYFEGSSYVGALIAALGNGGSVTNCYVTGTTVKGGSTMGTLVGHLGFGHVVNCFVDSNTLVGYDGYGNIENSYYLSETETEDGGKTAEQFTSGEVAFLLQSGQQPGYEYDENWNEIPIPGTEPFVWGQEIGVDPLPVFGGMKVHEGYVCCDVLGYTNKTDTKPGAHNFVDGVCDACGKICDHTSVTNGKCDDCGAVCYTVTVDTDKLNGGIELIEGFYAFHGMDYTGKIYRETRYSPSSNYCPLLTIGGEVTDNYSLINGVLTIPGEYITGDIVITCIGSMDRWDESFCAHFHAGGLSPYTVEWAEDYSSATFSFTCAYCDETATGTTPFIDVEVISEATCAKDGLRRYSAAFGDIVATEEESFPMDPFAHSWTDATCTEPKTCSVCKTTEGEVLSHNHENGVCTVCGHAQVKLESASLSFEEMIHYNIFFTLGIDENVALSDMGLIMFDSLKTDGTIDDAIKVYSGAVDMNGRYMVATDGVHAKRMGDMIYFRAYAKLADGSYVYSKTVQYSAVNYAMNILNSDKSDSFKALVVAMLNYGAEAQLYFKYDTDNLMNAQLTEEHQALVEAYRPDMLTPIVLADKAKMGSFASTGSGFSKRSAAVSFEGSFVLNYLFTPSETVVGDMTLYYWTAEDYNAATELTAENATGSTVMLPGQKYRGVIEGIFAKDFDETVYAVAVYSDGTTTHCTGVLAYSIGTYLSNHAAKEGNFQAIAKAAAVYCCYCKEYFGA